MENPASFDLNRAIQSWRDNLAQSPALDQESLDELESHLRDSVMGLESKGLSSEESFLVATRRLGRRSMLSDEFGKVNLVSIWAERFLWMILGAQVLIVLAAWHATFSIAAFLFLKDMVGKAPFFLLAIALFFLPLLVGLLYVIAWKRLTYGQFRMPACFVGLKNRPFALAVSCLLLGIGFKLLQGCVGYVSTRVSSTIHTTVDWKLIVFPVVNTLPALVAFAFLTAYFARKRLQPRNA